MQTAKAVFAQFQRRIYSLWIAEFANNTDPRGFRVSPKSQVNRLELAPPFPDSGIMRNHRGFTLVEILVVIVIIAVIATLVAPNVFRHVGRARGTTARAQIEMLAGAVEAYRMDNDLFPTTEQGLAALRAVPSTDPRPRDWRGPYLRRGVPVDPWGRPYLYRSPGVINPDEYDLVSLGRDGREGGTGEDADILGWK